MKRSWWDDSISLNNLVFIFGAFLLLSVPVRWILAALMSAFIHELCHIVAIKICGKKIMRVNIEILGTEIQTDELSGWQEAFCLAAGPAGSLSLLLLFRWIPLTAFCGGIQGSFNLLPMVPLDGGRILRCILTMFLNETAASKAVSITGWICMVILVGLFLYMSFICRIGKWPVFLLVVLSINLISRKTPCKLSQLRVQ